MYDAAGRVAKQTDPEGGVTTFGWDAGTETATTTDPDGVAVVDGYRGNVLLYSRNANQDVVNHYSTSFRTSWAADHFQVDVIMGIGYEHGVDSQSAYLISEWGYPNVGVVIAVTPMAGPETVMLDYSGSRPDGEPAVVYVGNDNVPRPIADSFEEFMKGFVSCDAYEEDDEDL